MAKRTKKTRPTPFNLDLNRAAHVFGSIDPELLARLAPRILELRASSDDPIVLLIDSPGGNAQTADALWGLLTAPEGDKIAPPVVGVCVHRAGSAAATLLTLCDHAVVYDHASLYFHGMRTPHPEVTQEEAAVMEFGLRKDNDRNARRLVLRVLGRILVKYKALEGELKKLRKEAPTLLDSPAPKSGVPDIAALAIAMCQRLEGDYDELPLYAVANVLRLAGLAERVREGDATLAVPKAITRAAKELDPRDKQAVGRQVRALQVVTTMQLQDEDADALATTSPDGIRKVLDDVEVVLEMADPFFRGEVLQALLRHGTDFFSPTDLAYLVSASQRDKTGAKFDNTIQRGYDKLRPLWAFTLTLCRQLQHGEFAISPHDAIWLGLIDEVIATEAIDTIPD
jgi:ATP-dependent protease ClpP protease subunit